MRIKGTQETRPLRTAPKKPQTGEPLTLLTSKTLN
jgi:hypothetical protein